MGSISSHFSGVLAILQTSEISYFLAATRLLTSFAQVFDVYFGGIVCSGSSVVVYTVNLCLPRDDIARVLRVTYTVLGEPTAFTCRGTVCFYNALSSCGLVTISFKHFVAVPFQVLK
jgi:hypothetical protein